MKALLGESPVSVLQVVECALEQLETGSANGLISVSGLQHCVTLAQSHGAVFQPAQTARLARLGVVTAGEATGQATGQAVCEVAAGGSEGDDEEGDDEEGDDEALPHAHARRIAGPERRLVFEGPVPVPEAAVASSRKRKRDSTVRVRCAACNLRWQFKRAFWDTLETLGPCLCTETGQKASTPYSLLYSRFAETELLNIETYLARKGDFRVHTPLSAFVEGRVSLELRCCKAGCGAVTTVKTNRLVKALACVACGQAR